MSFFAPRLYVAVAVKFHENWLLATYFVKWLHRLHRQQAIARQSEQAMTLAASVQCRRAFNHWKHCILLHALSIYLIVNVVFIASIMCYAQICSICIPRALLKCILSRWWWLFGVKEGILSELFYIGKVFNGHSYQKQFTQPGSAMSLSLCFLGCMIYLYVHVCFVLPWSVESFPFFYISYKPWF